MALVSGMELDFGRLALDWNDICLRQIGFGLEWFWHFDNLVYGSLLSFGLNGHNYLINFILSQNLKCGNMNYN